MMFSVPNRWLWLFSQIPTLKILPASLLENYNFPPVAEKVQLEFPFQEQLNDIVQEEELYSGQCKNSFGFCVGISEI